jgi:hypothetical protein
MNSLFSQYILISSIHRDQTFPGALTNFSSNLVLRCNVSSVLGQITSLPHSAHSIQLALLHNEHSRAQIHSVSSLVVIHNGQQKVQDEQLWQSGSKNLRLRNMVSNSSVLPASQVRSVFSVCQVNVRSGQCDVIMDKPFAANGFLPMCKLYTAIYSTSRRTAALSKVRSSRKPSEEFTTLLNESEFGLNQDDKEILGNEQNSSYSI